MGRAKRVAMADLRDLMGRLGYRDCRTLLNSGNLVFTADADSPAEAANRIERAMEADLGVAAPVMALSAEDFRSVVADCPLLAVAEDPTRLLVSFFMDPGQRRRLEPVAGEDWGVEAMALGRLAAYLWCPEGVLQSRLAAAIEKALGQAVTTRNWKTVEKIQALL